MICNKCNHKLPDDSEFCQYCGSKIENTKVVETCTPDTTDLVEKLSDPDITSDDALSAILKFQAKATIDAMKANANGQPDNEADENFGLVPEKPIFTLALKSVDGEEEYLNKLRTTSGERIKYTRRGSTSAAGINGMIDIYDTFLPNGQPYKTIYINMYGAKNSTIAPKGFVLMAPVIKTTAVKAPKQKKTKVRKPKKPVNKKLVLCLTIIPIAVIIVALLAVFVLIPGLKYNHAKSLLENGKYELAYSEFEKLNGYADSENMLLECRYVQAIKYRDAGDYELANKIFKSLGNYRDSKSMIHNHNYKVSNMTEATCTVGGSKTYKCTGCDHTYSEVVAKPSHKYKVVSSQEPTCQEGGYATHKCSLCADEYTETKGKVPHDAVLVSTTDSTCTAEGVKNYKCKNCDHTYSERISKKSHNYSAATCTAPKTCGTCGITEGQKLGHSNDLVCTRCGVTTFEKLVLSGIGDKYYTNFSLPEGTYNITINISTTASPSLYLENNGSTIVSTFAKHLIKQVKIKAMNNSILGIDTLYDSDMWTVIIEAVGN